MTTATQIKQIALLHFIENGYEGASLAGIANQVGIKKQSIYTHYKSKYDLFIQVTTQVINEEKQYIKSYFEQNKSSEIQELLLHFILSIKERYKNNQNLNINFLLRMAFMPPLEYRDEVISLSHNYFNQLEVHIKDLFSNTALAINTDEAISVFLTLFEGLLVELIYGDEETFKKKLHHSLKFFWNSISKEQ